MLQSVGGGREDHIVQGRTGAATARQPTCTDALGFPHRIDQPQASAINLGYLAHGSNKNTRVGARNVPGVGAAEGRGIEDDMNPAPRPNTHHESGRQAYR